MNAMSPDAENLQQSIIKQLDVRPFIDPEEEIAPAWISSWNTWK